MFLFYLELLQHMGNDKISQEYNNVAYEKGQCWNSYAIEGYVDSLISPDNEK